MGTRYTENENSLSIAEMLLASLEDELDELKAEAEKLVEEFWRFRNQNNEGRKTEDRSILGLRTKKGTRGISLEWRWYSWKKHGRNIKPVSQYIKKGRGSRYQLARLRRYARKWERDFVEEIENRASWLRKQSMDRLELMKALERYIDTQT